MILLERDIGFSLLLFVLFLAMLWVTTGRWLYLVIGMIAFAGGTYLAAEVLHQINQRVEIWLDPWKYIAPGTAQIGLQPALGELGLAKGGITGTGLGLGNPGAIPVVQSDFIFAAIGEELGLIGAVAVVVGFVLIVGSGLRASLRARSDFSRMAALGLTVIVGFQAFFIMAGVVRLPPAHRRDVAFRVLRRILARGELRARGAPDRGSPTRGPPLSRTTAAARRRR